jgi:tRNA-dihydrouridine synthase
VKLGSLELQSKYLVAPMESVSDAAYRRLVWSQGAGITWTEMIRARGLVRNNKATIDLIDTFEPDVLTGVQLLVANETELMGALLKIESLAATTHPHFHNLRAVDLNFGCPSPDVIRVGAGPALLKRKAKMRTILEAFAQWKRATPLKIGAITAKIRLGINRGEQDAKVYLPLVEIANDTLDALIVHARHARQESSEPPRWEAIAEIKAKAKIPIIGNGDVVTRADAEKLHAQSGCDGFMIARGAIRSPWVFRELRGAGSGVGSLAEIDAAHAQYVELSTRYGTKEKFRTWHAEGFRRMRARALGEVLAGPVMPANEHMTE